MSVIPLVHYFGERIGLYFQFTQFYIKYLLPISIIGFISLILNLLVNIKDRSESNETATGTEFYAILGNIVNWIIALGIVVWSCLLLTRW